MFKLSLPLLLLGCQAVLGGDVERWDVYELELKGPSPTGNPFADVQLSATFSLANASAAFVPAADDTTEEGRRAASTAAAAAAAPAPLVSLDFSQGTATSVPNGGTSAASAPAAQVLSATRSRDVPAGSPGRSLDLGADVTARHVVELPGNGEPFKAGLAGLRAFTVSGWVRVRDAGMGSGGDRILNYCNGGGGIDVVWDGSDGGRLKLAVNEWPDGDHPSSAAGTMPAQPGAWPLWRFFAVSYAADAPPGEDNVAWYFGDSVNAAARDAGAAFGAYDRGAVADPNLPLAFGNFGSGFHGN